MACECEFCARVDEWSATHCYRCDAAVPRVDEYNFCAPCMADLGLSEPPTDPAIYWRAREEYARRGEATDGE